MDANPSPLPQPEPCPCGGLTVEVAPLVLPTPDELTIGDALLQAVELGEYGYSQVVISDTVPVEGLRQVPNLTTEQKLYAHHVLRC